MAKVRILVGWEAHATKILAAVLAGESGQLQTFAMGGDVVAAARFLRRAGRAGAGRVWDFDGGAAWTRATSSCSHSATGSNGPMRDRAVPVGWTPDAAWWAGPSTGHLRRSR